MSNVAERLSTNGILVNFNYPHKVVDGGHRLIKLSPNSMGGVKNNLIEFEKIRIEQERKEAQAQSTVQPVPASTPTEQDTVTENSQDDNQKFYNVIVLDIDKAYANGDYHRGVRVGSAGTQHIASHSKTTNVVANQTSVEPVSSVSATPEEANLKHEEIPTNSVNIPPEEQPVEATDESKRILNELHISTENLISVNNEKQASQAIRDEKKKIHDETFKAGEMADVDLKKAKEEEDKAKKRKISNIEQNKQLINQASMMRTTLSTATRVTEENVAKLKQEASDLEAETNKEQHRIDKTKAATAIANQNAAEENKIADLYDNKNMEMRKQLDEIKARIQASHIQLQPINMDQIEAEQGPLYSPREEDNHSYLKRAA